MTGHFRLDRRTFLGAVVASAVGGSGAASAQQKVGERKIDPLDLPLDKPGVWTLNFRYKPPRIVTLDGIGKDGKPEKKVVWYMWYQVYNLPKDDRAAEPVTFLPEFELVTKDLNTTHLDEPQPHMIEQLNKLENPQNHPNLTLLSTIAISKRPIPPSKPDAIPRVVTGAAIWTDMAEKAPRTNKFSVYIVGLSNGQATEELRTGEKLIKRKTLQINFVRPTDDNRPQIVDIRPDDSNAPAEQWIYRTTSVAKSIGAPVPKPPG
ncbi:hypothetical protein [Frigoriglobus tundricola]|uniref:Uncharacterized protein n=1 Tax=Frigoriglobus tundricola TaxID=2774151 RepID=A0A6M5YP63_9BACT|nr:hypothetical protein [Frigoriglobus tundricola]QJW95785.1 hypothetical protein FTUN_3339 [Frigoriglobus tundricola]